MADRRTSDTRPAVLQVVIVPWFNAEADYAIRQGIGLASRGWPVTFMAVPGSLVWERVLEKGLPAVPVENLRYPTIPRLVKSCRRIRRVVKENRIGIVHFHRSEGMAALALAASTVSPSPLLVRTRGDVRRIRRGPLNRWLYRNLLHGLAASGTKIAREVETDLALTKGTVEVIPYGVDVKKFQPGEPKSDPPVVGYLGRLGPVKGVDYLLKAAEMVAGKGRLFYLQVMVKDVNGYPAEYRRLEDRARNGLLAGRIRLTGYLDYLPGELSTLTVGVVPSIGSEANCRSALEFMASGVPVIASRVGSLPEVVTEDCGFVVPPAAPEALAAALEEALEPSRLDGLAKAARLRAESQFSLEKMISATENFFERLLTRRKSNENHH